MLWKNEYFLPNNLLNENKTKQNKKKMKARKGFFFFREEQRKAEIKNNKKH